MPRKRTKKAPATTKVRTKKRRQRLLQAGLVQKVAWVPAAFAAAFMDFALQLRREAGILLKGDPKGDGEKPPISSSIRTSREVDEEPRKSLTVR